MTKARFKARLVWSARLGLFLVVGTLSVIAVPQTDRSEPPAGLPAINHTLEIKLDNLFPENPSLPASDQLYSNQIYHASISPMQLVGTLIMGENKIAWIKTSEYQIHELGRGQHVPGSEFRINRILTDSVELVNARKCPENSHCKPGLVLDLN